MYIYTYIYIPTKDNSIPTNQLYSHYSPPSQLQAIIHIRTWSFWPAWLQDITKADFQDASSKKVDIKVGTATKKSWLVLSTPLKHISQLGWLFPIYGKITNAPNHQPVEFWSSTCRILQSAILGTCFTNKPGRKNAETSRTQETKVIPWM